MKKTEFVEAIKVRTENLGYENVIVDDINKGSRAYLGMYIRKDSVPSPVVDLDALYVSYSKGVEEDGVDGALDGCMGVVQRILNTKPDVNLESLKEHIFDWDWVKPRLVMHPVDEDVAVNGVFTQVGDDYLCPYIDMSGGAFVRVTQALLDIWEVSEDEACGISILNDLQNFLGE